MASVMDNRSQHAACTPALAGMWTNGLPARVVVERTGSMWAVSLQNERGATLRTADGELEVSHPSPGNKGKTETEAKRLARAHGVPVYQRTARGHVRLPSPWVDGGR